MDHISINFCNKDNANRVKFSKCSPRYAAEDARRASRSSGKHEEEHNFGLEGQIYGADVE